MRLLPLSAALLVCPAWAAKWDIVPTLRVEETYTDNVTLESPALKRSDWVTQLEPGLSVNATGARLRFNASYTPQFLYYARGEGDNRVNHRLNTAGNVELAKQLLFVDAGASIDRVNISLQGPLTESNVNTTENRTTARTAFVSPYFLRDLGASVRGEARFTYSVLDSSGVTTDISDSDANRIDMRLASGPAYKLLTWNLAYNSETINYKSQQQDTTTEVITANARRLITPNVGLLAKVGYENYDSQVIGPALEGSTWSAGLDWTPTPRTHLAATAGHRFYGDAYSLDFRHRTRLTTWSAGYSEDVTSTRSQFFIPSTTNTFGFLDTLFLSSFPDPIARQKAVEAFIARTGLPPSLSAPLDFFSSQLFLVKRWQASAGILGIRNVLMVNLFKETREVLGDGIVLPGTGDFAASAIVRQTGASLLWNWRITPWTASNLSVGYTRNELPDISREDNLTSIHFGLTRQFQPRLSGSLNYRRLQNDSSQSGTDYTENAVSATLSMRF